jgi:hypothetical protein
MEAGFEDDETELDRLLDQMSVEELERLNSSLETLLGQVEILAAIGAPNNPFQL